MVIKERKRGFRPKVRLTRRRSGFLLTGAVLLLAGALAAWSAPHALRSARALVELAREMSYTDDVRGAIATVATTLPHAPRQYIDGLLHAEEIPRLRLDVKFKHWQKILRQREQALERGALLVSDEDEVPAMISVGEQAHRAKIRLKGDFPDHWAGDDAWSLRVKSDGHLFGMRRFSLHHPRARLYAAGPLFLEHLRREGILTPQYRLVHVTLNGNDWGLMELEEHIGTELLEAQGRKDGVIALLDPDPVFQHYGTNRTDRGFDRLRYGPYNNLWTASFRAYQEKKLREDPRTASNLAYAEALLSHYQDGALTPADVFDLEAFAHYLAAATLWGDLHALSYGNTRLYLNPFTLKIEPITGDIGKPLQPLRSIEMRSSLIVSAFMRDPAFREALARAIPDVTGHVLEGGLLEELEHERERLETALHRSFPLLAKLDLSVLRSNAEHLARYGVGFFPHTSGYYAERPPFDDTYAQHVLVRLYDRPRRQVVIDNLLHQPVVIERLEATCIAPITEPGTVAEASLAPQPTSLLENGLERAAFEPIVGGVPPEAAASVIEVKLPAGATIEATPLGEPGTELEISLPPHVDPAGCTIQATTRRPSTDEVRTAEALVAIPHLERHSFEATASPMAIPAAHHWLTWDPTARRFDALPGAWRLDEPLILPEGAGLRLPAGTTLAFAPEAWLLVRGPFDLEGSSERPVVLKAQNTSRPWKGVYVLSAGSPSRWQHAEIRDTAALEDGYLILTGAVTFYESDVTMTDVAFIGTEAEDALNIVHSKFKMERSLVSNTRSDGFDCDFCQGELVRSTFRNIGGDAFDISGSHALIEDLEVEAVHDKAVSVGEGSEAIIRNLRARNVGTAVASKDRSRAVVEGAVVEGIEVAALMTYVKKQAYGPARLEATDLTLGGNVIRQAVAQVGNVLILEGEQIEATVLDVETLYESGPMKK